MELHRETDDQQVGDKKLGQRDGDQRRNVRQTVRQFAFVDGRQHAQADGQGDGDDGGITGQEQGIAQARQQVVDDHALIGQGHT